MPIVELISLIRQGSLTGSKSTAMTPLLWLVGILMAGVVAAPRSNMPTWMAASLVGCLIFMVLVSGVAFGYFAHKDRDALRTERYTLTKMAIERYLSGDDEIGLTKADLVGAINAIGQESGEQPAVLPSADPKRRKPRPAKPIKTSEGQES